MAGPGPGSDTATGAVAASGTEHPSDAAGASDREPPGIRTSPDELADAVAEALARRPDPHATVHKPLIQVVVGLDTLLGGDRPAELIGHGPIPAQTARALAAGGTWTRLVSDPVSGTLLEHGRTTYTPPAGLADHVRARDQLCRGPHCTRRIQDLDHHLPWGQDGQTREPNLYGLCKHHHQLKDAPGWQVLAHPDRTLTWISPCGRRHTTAPYDYRQFTDNHPTTAATAPDGALTWGARQPAPARGDDDDGQPPF